MYRGFQIVCVTPAGRRRYMKLLAPFILSEDIVDRWDIWVNTENKVDMLFFEFLSKNFQKVKLIQQPSGIIAGGFSIGAFFRYAVESNTIYIRFDDDIVWIEPGFFKKFLDYRIENKEFFWVSPLVINNAICTHLLQINGKIRIEKYIRANAMDETAWKDPKFAYKLHKWFIQKIIDNTYQELYLPPKIIALNRFSINCISWFGEKFKEFNGIVWEEEEEYLSVIKPTELGLANSIYGGTIVSHFAFYTQREFLDKTEILDSYEKIIEKHPNQNVSYIYNMIKKFDKLNESDLNSFKTIVKRKIKKIKIPIIKFITIDEIYQIFKEKWQGKPLDKSILGKLINT